MSDTGDVRELDDLEPLDEETVIEQTTGIAGPPTTAEATLLVLRSGLPVPAYNPAAHKEYYRFLFAGVVILLGCLMPFGPDWDMAGYKTLTGALCTLIGLGIVWSMWAAIHTGRFAMKWILLAFLPFVLELWGLIFAFRAPAVRDFVQMSDANPSFHMARDWSDLMSAFGEIRTMEGSQKISNFLRAFGQGRIVVFLGALWAEAMFLMAIFGGVKHAKQQKSARSSAASERRRR